MKTSVIPLVKRMAVEVRGGQEQEGSAGTVPNGNIPRKEEPFSSLEMRGECSVGAFS